MFLPPPDSNFHLSILFFLQLTIILLAVRLMGHVARFFNQPKVIGEMIAGILLGPSLVGWLFPAFQSHVFPKESMRSIYMFAQVGLVLYMFLVGLEFDRGIIRKRMKSAMSVSVAGIIAPFALGALLAWDLMRRGDFFNPTVSLSQAMLYLGAAMSITAFPVLARIIQERGIAGTPLGTLTLAAGASDDAAAWCILAVVLATFGGSATAAIFAVVGTIAYALFCLFVLRHPLRNYFAGPLEENQDIPPSVLTAVLLILMICAYFTDAIGVHAVFGAFILGVSMPRGPVAKSLHRLIEPLTTGLFVPLFFIYSGLNTKLGLISSQSDWIIAIVVLAAAIVGKGFACAAAARINGESWRESLAIGALMNARGMMELIILNIGLEKGIISQRFFSIMVVMTLVTTIMATPAFNLIYSARHRTALVPVD